MKVHIVTAFDAEPYEYGSWVDSIFFNLSDAKSYVKVCQGKIFDQDPDNLDYGYMISDHIETKEVL